MKNFCCTAALCLIAIIICAQNKAPVTATRITSAPKINGRLDDTCWQKGLPFTNFITTVPFFGEKPSYKTEMIILYDNEAIYFGARCFMPKDSIWLQITPRDQTDETDAIYIGFDTYHDGQNGFYFGVSSRNVQADGKVFQNSEFDDSWDAVWDSETSVDENGWYAEFRIPYSALRFPKSVQQDWAFDCLRLIRSNHHEYHTCGLNQEVNGIVSQWMPLIGLSDIDPPFRLSLTPYATLYDNWYSDPDNNISDNSIEFKGGMDLKWGISESFTLDATLIPDFGQVQSDNIIYNLTAYEVQYDEKRGFFTEGTELFNKADLFYSRRIGLANAEDAEDDTTLIFINPPATTRLLNATKISGRTKGGLGIGFFNAVTGNTFSNALNLEGDTVRALFGPATNYNVLVLDQSLKNESYVTFTTTNVIRDAGGRDANVSNMMLWLANKKQEYGLFGYGAMSTIMTQSPAGSKIEIANGYLYKFSLDKISGNFTFDISHESISPGYEINDLGYLPFNNQNTEQVELSYDLYESFGRFNEFHSENTFTFDYRNNDGAYVNAGFDGFTLLVTKNYLGFFSYYFLGAPFHDYYEPRVEERYYEWPSIGELGMGFSTDYRKHFALDAEGGPAIWNQNGRVKYRWKIAPRIRIGDKLFIVPSSEVHLFYNDEGWVETIDESNIVFGRRDVTEIDNNMEGSYFFNSTVSIGLNLRHYWNKGIYKEFFLLQKNGSLQNTTYAGSTDYNFNAWNIDLAFTWWFLPGSEINVVWKNSIESIDDFTQFHYFRNVEEVFKAPQHNSFSIQIRYYLDYQMAKQLVN